MSQVLYQGFRIVFGALYPAYCSFKAVKTKNVKDYVHWMTYWIVFAVFALTEDITDFLLGFWFPLYYECKILLIIWLLSPVTRGSTLLYRQVIHPALINREDDIDDLMKRWKEQSYHLGLKYTKVAAQKLTKTVIETAIAGGGGLVDTLRHSYSMNDLRGVPNSRAGSYDDYDDQDSRDRRVLPQSWHEGHSTGRITEHVEYEDDSPVQTRAVRGRRKPQTGSLMALTNENDSDHKNYPDPRKRRTASIRQKDPVTSASIPRSGSLYGTLPRKPRKPRSPLPDFKPSIRRSTLSKENVSLEESDGESLSKQRTFSASPVRKGIRKKPPSSLEIRKDYTIKKEEISRPLRPKRKTAKTLQRQTVETDNISEIADMNEDSFSMTYSEEEKKEAKKKCEIS